MKVAAIVGCATWLLVSSPTRAEEITLACSFVGGERSQADQETLINQVVVNSDLPRIDLRVAETMGTTQPIDYTFMRRPTQGDTLLRKRCYVFK